MRKDEQFSVYRTPFKCKFKLIPKTSPPKPFYNNYYTPNNEQIFIVNSPYSTKYASQPRIQKPLHSIPARDDKIQHKSIPGVRLRMKSAPHRPTTFNAFEEKEKGEEMQFLNTQIKIKTKTQRETFVRSTSRKKIDLQNQLHSFSSSQLRRKFTFSVVNLSKQREKNRHLIDKKIESYNYKTVLGEKLTLYKKIPKLVINQDGVVKIQRS